MRQQFRFHRPLFLCLALAVISNVKPILMPPLVRRDNERVILFPFEAIWVILGMRCNHESVSKSTLHSYAVNTAFRYYITQIKFLSLSLNIHIRFEGRHEQPKKYLSTSSEITPQYSENSSALQATEHPENLRTIVGVSFKLIGSKEWTHIYHCGINPTCWRRQVWFEHLILLICAFGTKKSWQSCSGCRTKHGFHARPLQLHMVRPPQGS